MDSEKLYPKTNGGRLLRRGDSFDPEDWRTTHRLRVGQGILRGLGVEPTYPDHDAKCILNPANRFNRVFNVSYRCECSVGTDPTPTWPEWVTGAVFDHAYRLASEVQTERGSFHRSAAQAAKAERAKEDYTIATAEGVVIAQVEHHDLTEPGDDELDVCDRY